MPYGSSTSSGATLAATGIATGHVWIIAVGLLLVFLGVVTIRLSFRRGLEPTE